MLERIAARLLTGPVGFLAGGLLELGRFALGALRSRWTASRDSA
ncbi:MAG: hypothetical protein WBQ18_02335 [Solirubrobacteraceae bacterium]